MTSPAAPDSQPPSTGGTPGNRAGAPRRPSVGLTVRGIVLHENHVLLMRAEEPGRTWYFLPGGHVNHGELMPDALKREILEETGIHVQVKRPLYLREYIAARHSRRSVHMPPQHHVLGLLFLCEVDKAQHGGAKLQDIGAFPGDMDGSGGVKGMDWFRVGGVGDIEIMPPHVKRALMGEFPPKAEAGIAFWPEDEV